MNKQELIERLECLKNIFGNKNEYVKIDMVVELISELDEPQKVKIPQFVAEKIEYFKKTGDWDLFQAMDDLFEHTKTCEWLEVKDNQEKFALAWIFGYEIEKEKRYCIVIKHVDKWNNCLKYNKDRQEWYFGTEESSSVLRMNHTRKELEEAGFGWVFDCPGIEIEEVE